jgi:tetratricopeptide (TPR) repeat protein
LIDPMVGRFAGNLGNLAPLLDSLKLAPMNESFKGDAVLLTTECVIRAIEARTLGGRKAPVADQERAVQESMSQGFVLTRYFYDNLQQFEKEDIGFRNAIGPMISRIDVRKEQKQAGQIQFAAVADPELLQLARPKPGKLLINAQEKLAAGDPDGAEKLAKQALTEKSEDPGRALFILAQVSLNRNVNGAKNYFEQALRSTTDPKVLAWSHIYLGRILDLQDDQENGPDRGEAIRHYQAAVEASGSLPEAKAAAEQGIQKPYEPPKSAKGQAHDTDNSDSPSQ